MHECVAGGFDLIDTIREMVAKKLTHGNGTMICSGWQDQERVGKYRCLTKFSYEVNIEYL